MCERQVADAGVRWGREHRTPKVRDGVPTSRDRRTRVFECLIVLLNRTHLFCCAGEQNGLKRTRG